MPQIIIIISVILDILLASLGLWLALKILKFEKINIKHVLIVSIISRFIMDLPLLVLSPLYFKALNLLGGIIILSSIVVSIIFMILVIRHFFGVTFKKSILATFLYFVISILLSTIVIQVLFFVMQILLGSSMPFVIFTSGSMTHSNDIWRIWLEDHSVPKSETSRFPFQNGINRGDIVLVTSQDSIKLGDVILYNRDKLYRGDQPILHRVVGIVYIGEWKINKVDGTLDCLTEEDFYRRYIPYVKNCQQEAQCPYRNFPEDEKFEFYITKGDNNLKSDQCVGLLPVTNAQITGKAVDL